MNDIINSYYDKKKNTKKITLIKISDTCFEFGTQKIFASLINNNIRGINIIYNIVIVRVLGGDFLNFDKFIEINASLEQANITKKTISQKALVKPFIQNDNQVSSKGNSSKSKVSPVKKNQKIMN